MKKTVLIAIAALSLAGCYEQAPTGKACLGANNQSLVEGLGDMCKKGDIIATKNPAHFCDFNYSVTFNDYNSAFCVYVGKLRESRSN